MCWWGRPTGLWGRVKVQLAVEALTYGWGDPGSGGALTVGENVGGGGEQAGRGGASCLHGKDCPPCAPRLPACRSPPPPSNPCVVSQTNAVPTGAFIT